MFDYLVQRLAISAVTLVVISVIVFTGVRMIPGDPARVMGGTDADEAGLAEIRSKYGLNDPVPVQYLRWVGLALRGDLGESIRTRESVVTTVAKKLPITLELACLSILVALAIAVPVGVLSAARRNSVWDYLANGISLCGLSVPSFWLGIMLILLLSVRLHWLPASGFVPLWEDPLGNITRMHRHGRRGGLCIADLPQPPASDNRYEIVEQLKCLAEDSTENASQALTVNAKLFGNLAVVCALPVCGAGRPQALKSSQKLDLFLGICHAARLQSCLKAGDTTLQLFALVDLD